MREQSKRKFHIKMAIIILNIFRRLCNTASETQDLFGYWPYLFNKQYKEMPFRQ